MTEEKKTVKNKVKISVAATRVTSSLFKQNITQLDALRQAYFIHKDLCSTHLKPPS